MLVDLREPADILLVEVDILVVGILVEMDILVPDNHLAVGNLVLLGVGKPELAGVGNSALLGVGTPEVVEVGTLGLAGMGTLGLVGEGNWGPPVRDSSHSGRKKVARQPKSKWVAH